MSRKTSPHAVSDPQLRRWFLHYQRKYFPKVPPNTAVYWEPAAGALGDVSEDDNGDFTIRIDPSLRFSSAMAKLTLLHEIAHIACGMEGDHGEPFQREMQRLAKLGALADLW